MTAGKYEKKFGLSVEMEFLRILMIIAEEMMVVEKRVRKW
jgi:hypothetical protein